jgi:hypothetical protein
MCLVAQETSSLPGVEPRDMCSPSQGAVTPSTTSNTNLSLFTQGQRHGESSSRWEKLPIFQEEPFVHETTIDRLLQYSMGASPLFPKRNFSSMRRQLIDYHGTRWGKPPIFQEEFLIHETTIDRLPRYSTFGWDKFPISQEESFRPRGDNLSTTAVLDFRMGPTPYLSRP